MIFMLKVIIIYLEKTFNIFIFMMSRILILITTNEKIYEKIFLKI